MKIEKNTLIKAAVIAATIVVLGYWATSARATDYKKDPQPVKVEQHQGQGQAQQQQQSQDVANSVTTDVANTSSSDSASTSGATASNDGVQVGGDTSSVENNSSTVVLVPNNNTESCVRVFGLAFGKNGESGAIGFPWRSKKCDFEQAADDAFAGGERDLGWFWKCQNKNLYKQFQGKDESVETAIDQCHLRMLSTTSTNDVVRKLEQQLQATENMLELEKLHKEVCDESLERCTDKVFGGK